MNITIYHLNVFQDSFNNINKPESLVLAIQNTVIFIDWFFGISYFQAKNVENM